MNIRRRISRFGNQALAPIALSFGILSVAFLGGKPSHAANDLQDIFGDRDFPLNLKLKDLDGAWTRVTLTLRFNPEALIPEVFKVLALGTPGYSGDRNLYYSQGKTIEVGNEIYLVAYRLPEQFDILDYQLFNQSPGDNPCIADFVVQPLTPQTAVSLTLINLEAIQTFSEIAPLNVEEEIAASVRKYEQLSQQCQRE